MQGIISLQQKIAPELIELVERRYTILRHVSHSQPVGRRSLANGLKMGERIVRAELEFLKGQGLLEGDVSGVKLTGDGENLVHQLAEFVKYARGLNEIETRLREGLGLRQVLLVPGDSDEESFVKKEIGRAAAKYLVDILASGSVIAVTGGSTLREVAEAMVNVQSPGDVVVVPSRGGTGRDVDLQANTIAAMIAKKLRAQYRLLHVPDNLGEEAMNSLGRDPHIREITETIKSADILVHGIGNAGEISAGRGDTPAGTAEILRSGAVGEAFGHYFSQDGSTVKTINTLGIRLDDLDNIQHVIGVAGGRSKAAAILAVAYNRHENVLVTDEAAGRGILEMLGSTG